MPEGHIVKAVKGAAVDLTDAAHHGLGAAALGLRAARRHILVGDKHVAPGKVRSLTPEEGAHGAVAVGKAPFPQGFGDQGGKDIRHQPEGDRAVGILQRHMPQLRGFTEGGGDIQPLLREQGVEEGEALHRIMVPCAQQDRDAERVQRGEHTAEKLDRLAGRSAAVIDIPGDDDGVGAQPLREG